MNMLPVTLLKAGDAVSVNLAGKAIDQISGYETDEQVESGTLGFRPTDVTLSPNSASLKLSMYVESTELLGTTVLIHGTVSEMPVTIEVDSQQSVLEQTYIDIYVNSERMHIFNVSGKAIK